MDNNTIEMKMEGKNCNKCGEFKSFEDFYKNKDRKDGYFGKCKMCANKENGERYINKKKITRKEKTCNKCKQNKSLSEFPKSKREADGHSYECKTCQNERTRQYYKKNKEKVIQKTSQYGLEHPEIRRKATKKFLNSEKGIAYKKKWWNENIEKAREYVRQYQKTEKGRASDFRQKMKRRSYKYKVSFSSIDRKYLLQRDNWICQSCGCKVHDKHTGNWNTPDKAHIDHIIPISKGGNSEYSNLQVLCRTCNLSKQDKVEEQLTFFKQNLFKLNNKKVGGE